jgi:hypothetical protein
MKIRTLLLGLALCTAALPSAHADQTNDTTNNMVQGKLKTMQTGHSQHSVLWLVGDVPCSGANVQFRISRAHTAHDNLYRTALALKLANRDIVMEYELISGQCWVKRILQ